MSVHWTIPAWLWPLLLVMAASLICERLSFAIIVLVYLAVGCYTVMIFTLKRGLDAAAGAHLATESAPPPRRLLWTLRRDWPSRKSSLATKFNSPSP